MRSPPSSPLRMISRIFRMGGSRLWVWPAKSFSPRRSAASFMRSQSSMVSAMGFSTITCLPCSMASKACSACISGGVAT